MIYDIATDSNYSCHLHCLLYHAHVDIVFTFPYDVVDRRNFGRDKKKYSSSGTQSNPLFNHHLDVQDSGYRKKYQNSLANAEGRDESTQPIKTPSKGIKVIRNAGKTCVNDSWLIVVLLLISWQGGMAIFI